MKTGEMISMMKGFFTDYVRYRPEIKKHDAWIKKYAGQNGYRVNPHWMFYNNLKTWIAESDKTFGRRYCPCFKPGEDAALNKRLICPCRFAEEEIRKHGSCHCVLFGRGDLTDEQFKAAEARLMQEYRGVPLKWADGLLDTRGMTRDPLRNLPIPDSLHQVKRGLSSFKGAKMDVLVENPSEAENLRSYAGLKGIQFQSEQEGESYRITLTPRKHR